MKTGTVVAAFGFLLMFFAIVNISRYPQYAGGAAFFFILGLTLTIAGAIANVISGGKREEPPSPPMYEIYEKSRQQDLIHKKGEAENNEVQELKERLEEYRRELESTRTAYEQLEAKVKSLEDEIRAKDEIIGKLEKELELKEKTEQKHLATTQAGEIETLQQDKKAPRVRLIAYDVDLAVYDYIIAHQGTINLRKAAKDLGLSIEQLKEAIERLKKEGRLTES